jgi:putative colanic acid biosynthesis UDP-glucose lipid carrier transferase
MKEKFGYSRYFRSFQILADFFFINFFFFYVLELLGYADKLPIRTVIDLNLLWALSVLIINPYQVYRYSGYAKLLKKQLLILAVFLVLVSVFMTFFFGYPELGSILYVKILMSFALLFFLWKVMFYGLLYLFRLSGKNRRYYAVIGSGDLVIDFNSEIKKNKALGYYHLQTIPCTKKTARKELFESLDQSTVLEDAHIVYVCLPSIREDYLNELISFLETRKIMVRIILDFRSSLARKGELDFVDYIPVLNFISDPLDSMSLSIQKRIFDLVFSFATILLLSPLFIIVAVITMFSSKGPIFYRQERIGRKGQKFNMFKFRSMYTDAENKGPALTKEGDSRITPWGKIMRKYRLDEIPQFFNVLFGSMSVVGPRPEREFWKLQIEEHSPQFNRLSFVKPGITSLGQVKFGYAENVSQMRKRLRYDLLYLNNISIWMDLKIIFMTILVVLKGKGK